MILVSSLKIESVFGLFSQAFPPLLCRCSRLRVQSNATKLLDRVLAQQKSAFVWEKSHHFPFSFYVVIHVIISVTVP